MLSRCQNERRVVLVHIFQACLLNGVKKKWIFFFLSLVNSILFSLYFQACPLNGNVKQSSEDTQGWSDMSEFFTPAIKSVVDFAKAIPGFCFLSQDDQVTLLKVLLEITLLHYTFERYSQILQCIITYYFC